MFCIKANIPDEVCKIDDELKAIYHSKDSVCIFVFDTREERNNFIEQAQGMMKKDRKKVYETFKNKSCSQSF